MPYLEGYGVLKIWGELIELVSGLDELPKDSELRLFLDDFPDINPNPFLFWNFPLDILSQVNLLPFKASCTISL